MKPWAVLLRIFSALHLRPVFLRKNWGSDPMQSAHDGGSKGPPSQPPLPALRTRPMRLEDLDQVHALDRISFTLPWPITAFRYELLENPNSFLLVSETGRQDPQVVGMVVVWLIVDEAHIATIAVHPDYRRQGIGARMLKAALKESIAKGARTATLEVRASNYGAQELYQRFGFEVVGQRPRYYRDNQEDALIMTVDFAKFNDQGKSYLDRLEDHWM